MNKSLLRKKLNYCWNRNQKLEISYKFKRNHAWCKEVNYVPHYGFSSYLIENLLLKYPNVLIKCESDSNVFYINHLD